MDRQLFDDVNKHTLPIYIPTLSAFHSVNAMLYAKEITAIRMI